MFFRIRIGSFFTFFGGLVAFVLFFAVSLSSEFLLQAWVRYSGNRYDAKITSRSTNIQYYVNTKRYGPSMLKGTVNALVISFVDENGKSTQGSFEVTKKGFDALASTDSMVIYKRNDFSMIAPENLSILAGIGSGWALLVTLSILIGVGIARALRKKGSEATNPTRSD